VNSEPEGYIDLDPEPPRRRWPWEALLGLVLLAGVLGWAGADWWRTEQAARVYREGLAAVAARHWDAAAQAFAAAGTYSDAARQYGLALAQVTRRDDWLARAAQAASPGGAWHALAEAAAIEPDYPGLADRVDAAWQRLFWQGVAGTVVLQSGGAAPGLTLLTGSGAAVTLPGSDGQSRVRGRAPDGTAFLYDRGPGWESGACRLSCTTGRRQVVLAWWDGAGPLNTQVVGGDLPPDGSATFAGDRARFWWVAGGRTWYVDLAQGQAADVTAGRPGWRVTALAPTRGRVLLAGPVEGGSGRTPLALADAGGQAVQPLLPAEGTVLSAMFSADGDYLVYLTQQTAAQTVRALWRIDLRTPGAAGHELAWLPWGGLATPVWLGAFLPPGAGADVAWIYRLDGRGETVSQVNLRTGGVSLLWTGQAEDLHGTTAVVSPDGHTLAIHDWQGAASTLVLVAVDGPAPARAFPAPVFGGQSVQAAFAPGGDYVVYTVHNPDGIERGYVQPIYSLPTTAPAGTAPLVLARDAVWPYDRTLATLAFPPGGDLLLYVRAGGTLEATTLDGAARATLRQGVDAVWSVRDPGAWAWVR
jgi:hypothetical protein